jgi:alkanesulfonate monooxygenase SsuD/methylene tetrahydromethanopterin reductase-like flavin-dependent oxidoreductase (luciferase family)
VSPDANAKRIRTGLILPIFQPTAALALDVARRAEAAGIDGVFCYDHLWPMGQPERPALAPFPVLGLVAASTGRVTLGTLVARVGLVPDEVLLGEFAALGTLAPGRVIAGLGTGDRLSAGENEAYGVAFAEPEDRRRSLRACVRGVLAQGARAWVGDGAPATRAIAAEEGTTLNLWDAAPEQVADEGRRTEVTWAGPAPAEPGSLAPLVARLAGAGATWAVFPWPVDLDELAAAAPAAG